MRMHALARAGRVAGKALVWASLGLGTMVAGMFVSGWHIGMDVQRIMGAEACMPSTFYAWHRSADFEPAKGQYVVTYMPRHDLTGKAGAAPGSRLIKIIRATAGDHVKIVGTYLWINDEMVDRLWLAKSLPGKTVGDFDVNMVLGPDEYFLMGTEQASFDSRYWGVVRRPALVGYSVPVV